MQREAKSLKALIAEAGPQKSGYMLTEEAIKKMYTDKIKGTPLLDCITFKSGKICGYLDRAELKRNKETGNLELWGYFMYMSDEIDFSETGNCSCQIVLDKEDAQDNVIDKCSLVGCIMAE